ncbi:hypothetical protein ACIOGZ_26995 [Kitasatospora sp. NPDC088160]
MRWKDVVAQGAAACAAFAELTELTVESGEVRAALDCAGDLCLTGLAS